MTDAETFELLKNHTNMTEHDIRMHLRNGTIVYESYEDFRDSFCPGDNSDEELTEMWNDLLVIVDGEGKEHRIDFIL